MTVYYALLLILDEIW